MGLFNVSDNITPAVIGAAGSLIGGHLDRNSARAAQAFNYSAQKEFAQNGIRWRVEDAKAAGIHPLYALGASTASFSPVQGYSGDGGVSDAFASMSQGFSRAAEAKMTKEERALAEVDRERQEVFQLADLNMRQRESDSRVNANNASAYRDYVAARVAINGQQQVPAMPSLRVRPDGTVVGQTIPGQGDSSPVNSSSFFSSHGGGLISVKPSETTANALGYAGTEAAAIRDRGWAATDDGGYVAAKSDQMADRLDDDFIGTLAWHARNSIPALWDSDDAAPPKSWLPKGATHWMFDVTNGTWYPNTKGTFFRRPAW